MADWDTRFMSLAQHIGAWSKDRSTKVGCVIVNEDQVVVSLGYNGFPRGINDDDEGRHLRPNKYAWTEHAERNAIYNAARAGIALRHCTMYCSWFPCTDCARAIVQVGITRLVAQLPHEGSSHWDEQLLQARILLEEAGVELDVRVPTVTSSPVLPRR